jgi:hypothetical protein
LLLRSWLNRATWLRRNVPARFLITLRSLSVPSVVVLLSTSLYLRWSAHGASQLSFFHVRVLLWVVSVIVADQQSVTSERHTPVLFSFQGGASVTQRRHQPTPVTTKKEITADTSS